MTLGADLPWVLDGAGMRTSMDPLILVTDCDAGPPHGGGATSVTKIGELIGIQCHLIFPRLTFPNSQPLIGQRPGLNVPGGST